MNSGTLFAHALTVMLALSVAGPAMAATGQSHDDHGGSVVQLSLDHGRKWQTDAPLRDGMAAVRQAMTDTLDRIHQGNYDPNEYAALAQTIESQVDGIVKNCHLPEDADTQLHIVLAEVFDGIEAMKKGPDRVGGALTIIGALEAYGSHFDHPGFTAFQH